jgi:hypothetical protein
MVYAALAQSGEHLFLDFEGEADRRSDHPEWLQLT